MTIIDLVAPDIYNRDPAAYFAYLDHYRRPDNALMVPETGNAAEYARFFWATLGRGANLDSGYQVEMPRSLEDWGAPLGALAAQLAADA